MIKGFKYRIYPNTKQTKQLLQMFGNARFVYNWALKTKIEAYQIDKKKHFGIYINDQINAVKKTN